MTNAASRLFDIPHPPWDEVDMAVEDSLSRCLSYIHADIEANNTGIFSLYLFPH